MEAPQYIAEELLRAQGFTILRCAPKRSRNDTLSLSRGEYDLCFSFASEVALGLEARLEVTVLGGILAHRVLRIVRERPDPHRR